MVALDSSYCSLRSQQLGQNPFQITFGDGIIYLYETIKRKIRGINHAAYFAALDPMTLVRALPGNVAQGIIWGIMALGVYITFRILDFADLTVDGSLATGGAVAVMLIRAGVNPALALVFAFLAGMAAGFVTGVLHTFFGIPGILASILTQIGLTL